MPHHMATAYGLENTGAAMSCRATAMSRGHLQRASAAADYYRSRRVPERLEEALNSIYYRGPEDVYGHLSNYFAEFSDPPVISGVRGRKVLDGAGKTALEAEVVCRVRTIDKRVCAAAVSVDPESAPLLVGEAAEDAERERLESVETAITWIQDAIGPSLRGMEPRQQSAIDQLLSGRLPGQTPEDTRSPRNSGRHREPRPVVRAAPRGPCSGRRRVVLVLDAAAWSLFWTPPRGPCSGRRRVVLVLAAGAWSLFWPPARGHCSGRRRVVLVLDAAAWSVFWTPPRGPCSGRRRVVLVLDAAARPHWIDARAEHSQPFFRNIGEKGLGLVSCRASRKKAAASEKPIPPAEPQDPATRGALAMAAVSLAVSKSSAALRDIPLYCYIATLKQQQPPTELVTPTPLMSLLSCGKSSPGKLNLMQEIMLIPKPGTTMAQSVELSSSLHRQILRQAETQSKGGQPVIKNASPLGCLVLGCDRLDQPLELIRDACEHLGLELGTNVYLAINCAAHELIDCNKGRYEVISGSWKSPDEMVDLYVDLINRNAAIMALVDPLRREDRQQWETLGKAVGSRCYLMGDVASRSGCDLLQGSNAPVCSGPVLQLKNETTVSDLLSAVQLIEGEKRLTVWGCSSEECAEDSVVDLAVGLGVRFIKLGGLLRGERTAKYNRLLAIEEDLIRSDTLGRQREFEFPALWNDPQVPSCQKELAENGKNST
ncbi:enolase 4 [Rhinoderma darwinii]|uniref:enolase 4 n=1 Tax=Rhinoderma darwinii TaxID=43563 RepID=UPI003F67B1D3